GYVDIDDGVIGQLGGLASVVQVIVLTKCETAIEDYIFLCVERIWVDQQRDVMIAGKSLAAQANRFAIPEQRQLRRDAREQLIAGRIAPQNQMMRGDLGVAHIGVIL